MPKLNLPIPAIPIFTTPDKPLMDTTQNALPVAEILDDLILMKDGGAAIILESTSLNYGLLSEKEQQAVNAAYAALINSLSFSVQILVRSQRKDITNYLKYLDVAYQKITNPKLQVLMNSYKTFISETIKKKNVLSKKFYVVIPFSQLELGVTKSFMAFTSQKGALPFPKSYVVKKAKTTLYPRRDHLLRQMGRLGLKLRALTGSEIVELLYDAFNPPIPSRKQKEEVYAAAKPSH